MLPRIYFDAIGWTPLATDSPHLNRRCDDVKLGLRPVLLGQYIGAADLNVLQRWTSRKGGRGMATQPLCKRVRSLPPNTPTH